MTLTFDNSVARLRLDRPDHGNAFDLASAIAFRDEVREIGARDDVRVIVLSSAGPLFCAGGDVRAMAAAPDPGAFVRELAGTLHDGLVMLRGLAIPIVAAVHATAAGAGVGLVLAADIAIAADTAKFVSAYDRIGLSPDCGVSALLPAAIGARRAAQFALNSLSLDATTAHEWGLVSQVCSDEDLSGAVETVVTRLAAGHGPALGEAARLLRLAPERGYAAQLDEEADTIARLASGDAAGELIKAFATR